MRSLSRNQQTIWYALYDGEVEETDENGYSTGETVKKYSKPVPCRICVSQNKGETEDTLFGKSQDYDRTMTSHDMSLKIDEHSILWVDVEPHINDDGTTDTPHDYKVVKSPPPVGKRVGTSIVYAINKVT